MISYIFSAYLCVISVDVFATDPPGNATDSG